MNDETVERLELKLAFLEKSNQELSDVVYRQQQEIDTLKLQIRELLGRMESMREDAATQYSAEQERPPHY